MNLYQEILVVFKRRVVGLNISKIISDLSRIRDSKNEGNPVGIAFGSFSVCKL